MCNRHADERGSGPVPLVILLHRGFWRGRAHAGPLASALASAAYLACVPGIRPTGQPGVSSARCDWSMVIATSAAVGHEPGVCRPCARSPRRRALGGATGYRHFDVIDPPSSAWAGLAAVLAELASRSVEEPSNASWMAN